MPFLEKGKRGRGIDPDGRKDGFFNIVVGQNDALTHKFWISKRASALAVGILVTGLCCGGGLVLTNLLVK